MNIVKKYLPNNQYLPEVNKKKAIVLHHTVSSSAMSAIRWWGQTPDRVGCAYVIDRDGTVYEVFPPDNWAYALGIKGATHELDKISVQIEIVSWGHLVRQDDKYFVQLGPAKQEVKEEEVIGLNPKYRGYALYQTYTPEQIGSVIGLMKKLNEDFNMNLSYQDKFWEFNQGVIDKSLPGIWSHTTVRMDKDDIFPQPELLVALKEAFGDKVPKLQKKDNGDTETQKEKS